MRMRLPARWGAAFAAVAATVALGAAPALAFPTGPPVDCPGCPPGSMIVLDYFNSSGSLVGQKWWGCEGQAPGSWGVTTSIHSTHFVPC